MLAAPSDVRELDVKAGERALEAFHHPLAFAAFRGRESRLAVAISP